MSGYAREPAPAERSPGMTRAVAWCRETLAEPVLAAVFPPRCVCCGEFETFLCASCRDSLRFAGPERCSRCGHPGIGPGGPDWCPMCVGQEPTFVSARSVFLHEGPAKRLVTSFKYDGLKALGRLMAGLAADEFRTMVASLGPVVVTWVPSHASSERARGYNQAEILARELAVLADGVPVVSLARKVNRTVHQRGLDREGRQRNLRGAFVAASPFERPAGPLHSRAVVLVDDVYTTGATVAEVSRAIRARWESPVHVFTFGRTPADLPQRAD